MDRYIQDILRTACYCVNEMIVALLNYFKIRGEAYAYLRLRKEQENLLEKYLLGEILKRMHVRMLAKFWVTLSNRFISQCIAVGLDFIT